MNSSVVLSQPGLRPGLDGRILLRDLLAYDEVHGASAGIRDAFGDRFLCAMNPLYLRLREMSISCGFSYALVGDSLSRNYSAFPLFMLQDVIDGGVIPVLDTASVLRHLLARTPQLALAPNFLLSNLSRNHMLHESAHCVAYKYLSPMLGLGSSRAKQYVRVCLFCEAYANAVERIAAFDATDEPHKVIFSANSYIDTHKKATAPFGSFVPVLGLYRVLLVGISLFLRLNRGLPWIDADTRSLVKLQRAEETSESEAFVMALLADHWSTSLNPAFVNAATPSFFQYMGCEEEYRELCCGDLLGQDEEGRGQWMALLDALIDATCGPCALVTGAACAL